MWRDLPARAIALPAAVLLAAVSPAAQQPSTLNALLGRAAEYTATFVQRFSEVVAEEHYTQEYSAAPTGSAPLGSTGAGANIRQAPSVVRTLKSDYLLVKTDEHADWLAFRDVFEVDGRAVRDRDQRLARLFLNPSGSAVARASAIVAEGSRYAIGGAARTINNPLLALSFLQTLYQSRFRFTLRRLDKDVGPDVWTVDFEERTRPTIVRGLAAGKPDTDLVSHGRFWIDELTGRVMKTELKINDTAIVTVFRLDDEFGIAVPVEMREGFLASGGQVRGIATYGRFRRFNVQTEEKLP